MDEIIKERVHIDEDMKALAIMAHDIKAPLSAVVNILSVITKGYVTDWAKTQELVLRASSKTRTIIAMIDDILDYTLLADKSMMKREKLNLCAILQDTISTMTPYTEERRLTFKYPDLSGEKIVFGNYTFLLRVFNNLVMNAIKYNKENGDIEIQYTESPDNTTITVIVSDTGIGIPKEDSERIFHIFERGKYARRNINGSLGLGLSLVKQIVDDHDGKIELTSVLGVGTSIGITLPLYRIEKPAKEE